MYRERDRERAGSEVAAHTHELVVNASPWFLIINSLDTRYYIYTHTYTYIHTYIHTHSIYIFKSSFTKPWIQELCSPNLYIYIQWIVYQLKAKVFWYRHSYTVAVRNDVSSGSEEHQRSDKLVGRLGEHNSWILGLAHKDWVNYDLIT